MALREKWQVSGVVTAVEDLLDHRIVKVLCPLSLAEHTIAISHQDAEKICGAEGALFYINRAPGDKCLGTVTTERHGEIPVGSLFEGYGYNL
ncbi:MAG: hypothetical protein IT558_04920 [Alphaproteobacteria bacterium]|nr:hypothetical protein [Alphaproteobacteria bacterium]